MAYAAVTSLQLTLDLIISSDAHLMPQVIDQLTSLGETLMFLKGFLEDLEGNRGNHEKVKMLERKIQGAAQQAEDIVEAHLYNMRSRVKLKKRRRKKDSKIFQRELMQVMEEIMSIKKQALAIVDDGCDPNTLHSGRYFLGSSSWHSPNYESNVVGLEKDLEKFQEQLTGLPRNLKILTIVGMGGIGKSTLAKRVYEDPLIVYHFHARAWVTVSQDYQVRALLLDLIHCVTQLSDDICAKYDDSQEYRTTLKDGIYQLSDLRLLAEQLYRSLKGKRYLIIMDDIWCDAAWGDIKRSFPDDKNGSRIILTSRLTEVALSANPDWPPHHMRFLSSDEGWELLKLKVFAKESCPPELENIGKQIADKCHGLPLAIVLVAGHLSKMSKTEEIWLNNVGSLVATNQKQVLNIIAMSYNHLPHHLKACFLYIGASSENVEIPVWKLIALWIAEGFLKREPAKILEKVAEECLEDLIDRNLILAGKRTNDRVTTCRIHDMVRDFCLKEAQKENFWHVLKRSDLEEDLPNRRRLCVHSDIFTYANSEGANPHVRTFLSSNFSTGLSFLKESNFSLMGFKLLRVLDILTYYFSQFPVLLIELIHLRFLALSTSGDLPAAASKHRKSAGKWLLPFSKRKEPPVSISNLVNLQVLIINWGWQENHLLPVDIQTMALLRHIRLKGAIVYFDDLFLAEAIGTMVLSNLQTLSTVSSSNFGKNIVSLIPNIKKLGILVSGENDEHPTDFLNCLSSLHCLDTLKLLGRSSIISRWNTFPPNLRSLTLSGSHLPWRDMVTIGKMANLEVLKLKDSAFVGHVWETVDGGFIKLKFLLVENNELEEWIVASSHFPSLQHLVLRLCDALEEIPCGIGEIPTLEVIELYSCGRSAVSSAKRILEEQQSMGNDDLEVRINLV